MKTYKPTGAPLYLIEPIPSGPHMLTGTYTRKTVYTYAYVYFKYVKGWLGIKVLDEGIFTSEHYINPLGIANHNINTYVSIRIT